MNRDRTVVVTGGNKGIGYEVARQLAQRGFHVFVGARRRDPGNDAVREITSEGGVASFLEIDVADQASVTRAARHFATQSAQLDALVNNAGVLLNGDDAVLALDEDIVRRTLETNALGPLRVAQAFATLLGKSSRPRIINVSSGGGQLTGGMETWAPAYCISKAALNAVTCQLAAALPSYAVNSVCPGWVRTDMGGATAPRTVAEGADTIVWLADEAPQNLTAKFLRDKQPIAW